MLPQKILKFRSSEMRPKWPPSLFNQPRGNSLGARLNFIMIPLKMAERSYNQLRFVAVQKSC